MRALLLIPLLFMLPVAAAAQEIEIKDDGTFIEVIKDPKYDERSDSKNYTCTIDDVYDDIDEKEKRYKQCEKKYDPCVTESYLVTDEEGNHQREYRCEPNHRMDFYFIFDVTKDSSADAIFKQAEKLEKNNPSKYDNLDITVNRSDSQVTVYGSFEHKSEGKITDKLGGMIPHIKTNDLTYGHIQISESWHHIADSNMPCNVIDSIEYGTLPDF